MKAPPRFAVWVASLVLPRYERESTLGDLEEEYRDRARASSRRAHAWYWGQVALFIVNEVVDRVRDPVGIRRAWMRESVGRDPIGRSRDNRGVEVVTMWIGLMQTTRRLARDWRFSAAMTLILSLGIGGGLMAYSVVDGVVMQPLPYEAPDELGLLRIDIGEIRNHPGLAMAEVIDVRALDGIFSQVEAAAAEYTATLERDGQSEPILGAQVTPGLFGMLGVNPAIGRDFTEADLEEGEGGLIVSHAFWRVELGGDTDAVGRTLRINGQAVQILGVMPPDFALHMGKGTNISADVQFYRPLRLRAESRNFWGFRSIGRLADGRTFDEANAALETLAARLLEEFPDDYGDATLRFAAAELHEDLIQDARAAINAALGGVLLLLLVAFANSASLMLGRQKAREGDLAVRNAMGAGRGRLVATVLGESLVLASVAGLAGMMLASWGVVALRAMSMPGIPRWSQLTLDWSFFGAAMAFAILGFLASGFYPAWKASSGRAWTVLRGETLSRGATGAAVRQALVGVQIALAVVLLFAALVLGRSTSRLAQVDLGFDPSNTLTMAVPIDGSRFSQTEERWAFHRELLSRIDAMPGVTSVGAVSHLPLTGYAPTDAYSTPAADTLNWGNQLANYFAILPGYLATLDVEVQRGRLFENRDLDETRRVAVVDESLVEGLFPGMNPIGQVLKVGWGIPDVEIIGVIRHPRVMDARADVRPQIYVPYTIFRWPPLHYTMRMDGVEPAGLAQAIRLEADALGAGRAAYDVRTLESYFASATQSLRMTLTLIGALAGLTALLAAFGLFSVMAYLAYQTRRATAIRSALGATRPELLKHHLRGGAGILMGAIPLGLILALAGSKLLQSLVYETPTRDVMSLAGAAILATVVGSLATYLPARSAAKCDPMRTLRSD